MKKRTKIFLIIIAVILLAAVVVNVLQNHRIIITPYSITSEKLSPEGGNIEVLQLSDLHFVSGKWQIRRILEIATETAPDIIVITGDLIDAPKYARMVKNRANDDDGEVIGSETIDLCIALAETAPCYFIYGNHEMSLLDDPDNNEFKLALEAAGINIINNTAMEIGINGQLINLLGVQDPSTLYKDPVYAYCADTSAERVDMIMGNLFDDIGAYGSEERFNLVLSHRAELFDIYCKYPADLVLTGHAHGGQIRIPFLRLGLFAPSQGLFPKYTDGLYSNGSVNMLVSRGIGNSIFPFRIFNTPEALHVTISAE
ncbi:MAG: metallophosphoesterase [Lachnospiraceae bacterium]